MCYGLSCCEECSTPAVSAAGSGGRLRNERRLQTTNGRVASTLVAAGASGTQVTGITPTLCSGKGGEGVRSVLVFFVAGHAREGTKSFLRSTVIPSYSLSHRPAPLKLMAHNCPQIVV